MKPAISEDSVRRPHPLAMPVRFRCSATWRASSGDGTPHHSRWPMFEETLSHADPIGIRMGAFDDDPGIRPSVRQFVADAAPWEPIPDDGLPRFPGSRHEPR